MPGGKNTLFGYAGKQARSARNMQLATKAGLANAMLNKQMQAKASPAGTLGINANTPLKTPSSGNTPGKKSKVKMAVAEDKLGGPYGFRYNNAKRVLSKGWGLGSTSGAYKRIIKTYNKSIKSEAAGNKKQYKDQKKDFNRQARSNFVEGLSKNASQFSAKTPFIGSFFAVGEAGTGLASMIRSVKGGYFKEAYWAYVIKNSAGKDTRTERNISNEFAKRFTPSKFMAYNNEKKEYMLKVDKLSNSQPKVATISRTLHEKMEELMVQGLTGVKKPSKPNAPNEYASDKVKQDYDKKINEVYNKGMEDYEEAKKNYYKEWLYRQSINEENPEGFTPKSQEGFYTEQWQNYRDSTIGPSVQHKNNKSNKKIIDE